MFASEARMHRRRRGVWIGKDYRNIGPAEAADDAKSTWPGYTDDNGGHTAIAA